MTVRFHLFDAFDEIPDDDRISVLAALEIALPRIRARLPVDRVDVIVGYSDPFWVIPAYGIGGFSHGKGRISITLAPDHPRFADPERRDRLAAVLAHELHHIARSRSAGYGRTLGEALVSEGLAQCFEVEIGRPPPPYAVALKGEALGEFAGRAREQMTAQFYDHGAWFYGRRGDANFPKDGGYSLGYALVKARLADEATTAAAAASVPAAHVTEAWSSGRVVI
ncbi:MAG: DUF2268 domain-containing putative Zn-dependent protease [Pseudolabrys sp.]